MDILAREEKEREMTGRRILSATLACMMTVSLLAGSSISVLADNTEEEKSATQQEVAGTQKEADENDLFYIEDSVLYADYLLQYQDKSDAKTQIMIDCIAQNSNLEQVNIENISGVSLPQDATLEYNFQVENSGFYNLKMLYYPLEGADTEIEMDLKIDGNHPFRETSSLGLSRKWGYDSEIKKDDQGNEIRPDSVEIPGWIWQTMEYTAGKGGEALKFYLEAGEHSLSLTAEQNAVALSKIIFDKPTVVQNYQETLAQWEADGYTDADESLDILQAELISARSDKGIAMSNDRTSAATTPYHSYLIRYNCVGGDSWKSLGDWIEWEVDVPKTGLYTLALRFKQSEKTDDISIRTLTIDGELPFGEAADLAFSYDGNWQTMTLGDEEQEYKFLLEEGTHTIRMTASLGRTSEIINSASDILEELNQIYINIIMVTGTDPDVNRDYGMKKLLPEVFEKMEEISGELKNLNEHWKEVSDRSSGNSTFERLYDELDRMVKDPEKTPKRLKNFQNNITSLSTWINDAKSQPLTLDYLQLTAPGTKTPKAEKGFLTNLKHHINQFIGSFRMDYSAVGNVETEKKSSEKITVWLTSGRDQSDIVRKMVNSEFTPEYGIEVEVQLVTAGALLPATLADIGPDVCLEVIEADPVNYALRNAVMDLSELEGADEVFERFHQASLTPFELDDGVYALPETLKYPMLFYRKDILTELGIQGEDLEDWDSILQKVLPELELAGFDFGFTTDVKNYASLLYQHGGIFYNEEKTRACLDETEAYTAFNMMTRMYTDYQIPLAFDFMNRFRSGEMPLAVTDYSAYNQLSVFAPEIEGLWGMSPLPGVRQEDGSIDNTAACTVTGAVIMKNSEHVDAAWQFLKWWTSSEVQSEYASELESVMGTAARYATANLEAMESVQWAKDIKEALTEQQQNLRGMEQIPGSYYTTRYYDFAFRAVVNNGGNDREELLDANENINNEIEEKRLEFYGEEKHGTE